MESEGEEEEECRGIGTVCDPLGWWTGTELLEVEDGLFVLAGCCVLLVDSLRVSTFSLELEDDRSCLSEMVGTANEEGGLLSALLG